MTKLRDYQIDAVQAILDNPNGIISAATGSGKTTIMASAIEKLNLKKQIVFVHKQDLVIQNAERIAQETDLKVGQYYENQKDDFNKCDVLVSTWQSMSLLIADRGISPDFFDAIHVDEAHNITADEYANTVSFFKTPKRYGYTATWKGKGEEKIVDFFGQVIYDINIFELIDLGYLSKMRFFIHTDNVPNASKKINHEYQKNKWNHIINICNNHTHTTKAIHYFSKLKEFSNSPINFQPVTFKESNQERQNIFSDFNRENSGMNHLFSSRILNEGVDLPICNTLVFHENVGGFRTFNQRIGRGLRKWEGNIEIVTDIIMFINKEDEYNMREVVKFVDKVKKHNSDKSERTKKEWEIEDVTITLLDKTEEFIASMRERMESRNWLSYEELQEECKKLGITSSAEYANRYKEIKGATSGPNYLYKEWINWADFFGKQVIDKISYKELKKECRKLGITLIREYQNRYKEIKGAPARPFSVYPEWISWAVFFGKQVIDRISYKELKKEVNKLGITNKREYYKRYKEIKGAPVSPIEIYPEWINWDDFLGKTFLSYKELKKEVNKLGITSVREYYKRYKEIKGALSGPYATYSEWTSWRDFLDK